MSEVITLSSDDEEVPKKSRKIGNDSPIVVEKEKTDDLLDNFQKFIDGSEVTIVERSLNMGCDKKIANTQDDRPAVIIFKKNQNKNPEPECIEIDDDDDELDSYFNTQSNKKTQEYPTTKEPEIDDSANAYDIILQESTEKDDPVKDLPPLEKPVKEESTKTKCTEKSEEESINTKDIEKNKEEEKLEEILENSEETVKESKDKKKAEEEENVENANDNEKVKDNTAALKLLEEFLDICTNSVKNSKFEERLLKNYPAIRKYYGDCSHIYSNEEFLKLMNRCKIEAALTSGKAVLAFEKIYSYLIDNSKNIIIIDADNLDKVKKLERTCTLLIKKIKMLDEEEVDWSDEENSSYLKSDRYKRRLKEVYAKYCEYINRDPYLGQRTYKKIKFSHSKHQAINVAITKFYRKNKFPTYCDVEKIVKKCVKTHELPLSNAEISVEAKSCFEKLGNSLQLLRKKDLYETQRVFIEDQEDPAKQDKELSLKLAQSLSEGQRKLKEVMNKYVVLQETNKTYDTNEDNEDTKSSNNSETSDSESNNSSSSSNESD